MWAQNMCKYHISNAPFVSMQNVSVNKYFQRNQFLEKIKNNFPENIFQSLASTKKNHRRRFSRR